MAYNRGRKGVRRYNRKPRNQYGSYFNMAKKALSTAKWVAGLINVEKKTATTAFSSISVGSTSSIFALSLMATGTTDTTRNGNSIKASSNSFKYTLQLPTAATQGCAVRFIIFLDKVSNGTNPLSSDLLDNVSAGDIIAPYNRDNAGSRFIILKDVKVRLEKNGRDHTIGSIWNKLRHHVKFDGTTNTIADATTGHIFVLMVSDASVGTNYPTLQGNNVFSYIDN